MKGCLFLLFTPMLIAAEPATITEANARTFYRAFVRLTKEPRHVAPLTAVLCRPPGADQQAAEKKATGPHYQAYVHIYASPAAATALSQSAKEFPEGAILVKEKLGLEGGTEVAGMIKRAKGFDPANGDWEYFFHDEAGKLTLGKMANCADCHNGARGDHMFTARQFAGK